MLLGACTGPVVSVCPPLHEYDEAFEQRLAFELELLPNKSAIAEFVIDGYALRAQIRLCR